MKNKFITLAGSSLAAALLLVAGTASAHTLSLNAGVNLGAQGKATMEMNHPTNDNDNDGRMYKGATTTKPVILAVLKGTGQPVVGGTVSAVNGNTLTVVTATGVTYTVDASASTVVKGNATTTASTIAVGSKVLVQGAINGSSVTASSVIATNATSTINSSDKHKGFMFGVWGRIGGFFHGMFGFF